MNYLANEDNMAEFCGQIVDMFEDYLEEKGVTPDMLPNEDRDAEDDECAAIIYGEDYDIIADNTRDELTMLDFDTRKNFPLGIVLMVARHIVEGYHEVANKIQGVSLTDKDIEYLELRVEVLLWRTVAAYK